MPKGIDQRLVQLAMHKLFWDFQWYKHRPDEESGQLITERPIFQFQKILESMQHHSIWLATL
jgi:hypothetical protein